MDSVSAHVQELSILPNAWHGWYSGGEVLIEDALKALEIEFGGRCYRIHRNALISLSRVKGLMAENDGHYVSFQGIDNTLEVSRRPLSSVRKMIKNM